MLTGCVEMVNKAELMLEELLSSALEIPLSVEEQEALMTASMRGGNKKECILGRISQRISVPVQWVKQGRKVMIFGKVGERQEAKKIFEEELKLVKKALSSR